MNKIDEKKKKLKTFNVKQDIKRALKNGAFISLEDDKQKKTIEWLVENSVGDHILL